MTEEIKTVSIEFADKALNLERAATDKAKQDLKNMGMQLEAATNHVETLDKQLEAVNKLKAMADNAIVDQHAHIQQLQQLLVRYII